MSEQQTDQVFSGFQEWWHFTKHLSFEQRALLSNILPPSVKKQIEKSYQSGGWADLICRDKIDKVIDFIREEYGYDMLDIRRKVLIGKSIYLPRLVWEYFDYEVCDYSQEHKNYAIGGIKGVVCEENNSVVLLVIDESSEKESVAEKD